MPRRLAARDPAAARIVVAHHHFAPAPDYDNKHDVLHGARRALDRFTECAVDMILGGHLHRAYVGNSLDVYPSNDRTSGIIIVQSGTSTSQRGRAREREKNSFNVIEIDSETIRVTHHMFFHDIGGFPLLSRHLFPRRHRHYLTGALIVGFVRRLDTTRHARGAAPPIAKGAMRPKATGRSSLAIEHDVGPRLLERRDALGSDLGALERNQLEGLDSLQVGDGIVRNTGALKFEVLELGDMFQASKIWSSTGVPVRSTSYPPCLKLTFPPNACTLAIAWFCSGVMAEPHPAAESETSNHARLNARRPTRPREKCSTQCDAMGAPCARLKFRCQFHLILTHGAAKIFPSSRGFMANPQSWRWPARTRGTRYRGSRSGRNDRKARANLDFRTGMRPRPATCLG